MKATSLAVNRNNLTFYDPGKVVGIEPNGLNADLIVIEEII